MKKYFISVLIPYLLLQFSGCYSIQKVTKDEYYLESERPDMIIKTTDQKEILFDEGNYTVDHDTIYGTGERKLKTGKNITYEEFEGSISINDVEEIRIDKFDLAGTIGLCVTIFGIMVAISAIFYSDFKDSVEQYN